MSETRRTDGVYFNDGSVISGNLSFSLPESGAYCESDEERYVSEAAKSEERTAYQRDRDRVVHSSALRRLGAKTQILVAGSDDFARTRLTHSLEAAQIGREIAAMLGCDPDIVDCACLAHDLGHPPFGHTGEKALSEIAVPAGGFEGNAQTIRLLTRLEPKIFSPSGVSAGLNLTRAALDAVMKYPWTLSEAKQNQNGETAPKFCVYPDDLPVFRWLKKNAPADKTPIECQIMDLADDIAYSVHDVEDAIVCGTLNPQSLADSKTVDAIIEDTLKWYAPAQSAADLQNAFERLVKDRLLQRSFDGTRRSMGELKNITSALIGRFASSVEAMTREKYGKGRLMRYSASLVVPETTRAEILFLKGIAVHFVMIPRNRLPEHEKQKKIIADLTEVFMKENPNPSPYLGKLFMRDWERAENDAQRLRVAIDKVAGLTDASAASAHAQLCS